MTWDREPPTERFSVSVISVCLVDFYLGELEWLAQTPDGTAPGN